jgi:hypothetical protein
MKWFNKFLEIICEFFSPCKCLEELPGPPAEPRLHYSINYDKVKEPDDWVTVYWDEKYKATQFGYEAEKRGLPNSRRTSHFDIKDTHSISFDMPIGYKIEVTVRFMDKSETIVINT